MQANCFYCEDIPKDLVHESCVQASSCVLTVLLFACDHVICFIVHKFNQIKYKKLYFNLQNWYFTYFFNAIYDHNFAEHKITFLSL